MDQPKPQTKPRAATLWEALVPVIALIVMVRESLVRFEGTAHIPLLLGAATAALVGWRIGHHWNSIEAGIVEGISIGLKAILILMVIGMLIGTWIASGIVPVLIYHGLNILHPSFFLVAACVICCIVSISTGSSWTTAGTVGIALIGVGQGLGVPLPMVAGAIVSGAYFGDKLSPLSDTTNLAPAVAGSELFEHVRYMLYTTVPSLVIALAIYAVLGWSSAGRESINEDNVTLIRETLNGNFNLNPVLLLPPLLVVLMVALRLPALPALLGGVLLGGILAAAIQGTALQDVLAAAHKGFVAKTGVGPVDDLLTRGGLESMMPTVSLILCALTFGGVMERTGLLAALANGILRLARGVGGLVSATVVTCLGMNVLAPDQYLSIIVPGRMYREAYERQGLHPKVLSRTLEDAGTLTSPLVPWNTCGAFMSTTLGVSALAYLPYAFLNLLNPIIAIVIAFAGWKIAYAAGPGGEAGRRERPSTRARFQE
jgi:NhaC family Na+:H+ antiporter